MDYSENWLRFCKAEDEYFTCRYELMQDKEAMVNDLRIALLTTNHRETALRLLVDFKLEVVLIIPLFPMIVDAAVDSSGLNTISLARTILFNYKDELQVRNIIRSTVSNHLADNDEWHFRRTAELYKLLGYDAEFANLIAASRVNDNAEIRELYENFGRTR